MLFGPCFGFFFADLTALLFGLVWSFAPSIALVYFGFAFTTPVSLLANEFDFQNALQEQVSLAAVNHILCDS